MKRITISLYTLLLILTQAPLSGQDALISLDNPSFEDTPRAGGPRQVGIKGWFDCGSREFRGESPPDVHTENPDDMIFGVTMAASEGDTYLGIVTRENETWESVSQKLSQPLEAGKCYTFSIDLACSDTYFNIMQTGPYDKKIPDPTAKKLKSKPAVLRIWGGISYCPRNQLLAESDPVTNTSKKPPHLRRKKKEKPKKEAPVVADTPTKEKILKNLDRAKIFKGQKINVDNLYFEANKSEITEESFDVLNEVVVFLQENEDVRIEVGGHTNGTPKHEFCDSLSRVRAKEVAQYLNKNGVRGSQLQFKGYGKRKPIADNNTKAGRKKNQRVEIKILSVNTK